MGAEVGTTALPGDSGKAYRYEHGIYLGQHLGQVQTAKQGVIYFISQFLVSLNYCVLYEVGWFTSDGVAVNCTTLCMLQDNSVTHAG